MRRKLLSSGALPAILHNGPLGHAVGSYAKDLQWRQLLQKHSSATCVLLILQLSLLSRRILQNAARSGRNAPERDAACGAKLTTGATLPCVS